METIRIKTRIGSDGVLKFEMPVGVANVDAEIVVVYTVQSDPARKETWADYVNATYGILADDPIARPVELPLDVRDEIE